MALGTSKLNAVNTMLSAIGEAPINSLAGPRTGDVAIAENLLDETTRVVQAEGWDFNTEVEYELLRDSSNEIVLPADTLAVRASRRWESDLTVRGNRLYNVDDQSYTWTKDVKVTLVRSLDYEDMPEPAKQYVMHRSARLFRMRLLSDLQDRVPSEEEIRSLADMRSHEAEAADHRLSDAYDVGRATRNRHSPRDGHIQ